MLVLPEQLFWVMKLLLIDTFGLFEHLFSLAKLLQIHFYGFIIYLHIGGGGGFVKHGIY